MASDNEDLERILRSVLKSRAEDPPEKQSGTRPVPIRTRLAAAKAELRQKVMLERELEKQYRQMGEQLERQGVFISNDERPVRYWFDLVDKAAQRRHGIEIALRCLREHGL